MTDSSKCAECGRTIEPCDAPGGCSAGGWIHENGGHYCIDNRANVTDTRARPAAPESLPCECVCHKAGNNECSACCPEASSPKPAPPDFAEIVIGCKRCYWTGKMRDFYEHYQSTHGLAEGSSPSEPFMSALEFLDEYPYLLRIRDGEHKRQIAKFAEAYAEYLRKGGANKSESFFQSLNLI